MTVSPAAGGAAGGTHCSPSFPNYFPNFQIFPPIFHFFFFSPNVKSSVTPTPPGRSDASRWSLPSPIAGPGAHPIVTLAPSPAGASRHLPGSPMTPPRAAREGVKLPNPFFFVFFPPFFNCFSEVRMELSRKRKKRWV